MINDSYKANFETLSKAFYYNDARILEVKRKSDDKEVAAVCALNRDGEEIIFAPLATMIEGNPYEDFEPPNPEGGYHDSDTDIL
jgi:hypothetical protein